MGGSSQEVKARAAKITSLLTCPICSKIFRNTTTISECLHSFCRKCIYKKIKKEDIKNCPVCNLYLGGYPLEKLRPDHTLQGIRTKIVSSARREGKKHEMAKEKEKGKKPEAMETEDDEHEDIPSTPLHCRRKERSLSSLVNSPNSSNKSLVIGRRKSSTVKTPHVPLFSIDEPFNKMEGDKPSSNYLGTPNKNPQDKKRSSSEAECSNQKPGGGIEDKIEPFERMHDLQKPLNFLAETMAARSSPQSIFNSHNEKSEAKDTDKKSVFQNTENGTNSTPSDSSKPIKAHRRRKRKTILSEGLNVPAQVVVDASSNNKFKTRVNPIWLSLVVSDNQEESAPLPQIPSRYLKLKDGNLTVSFIKKYLAQKLDLHSENEVEISLMGQPLPPSMQLKTLTDLYSKTAAPPERIKTFVGSSANEFVAVLSYGRKAMSH